jgi:hypothetical protein
VHDRIGTACSVLDEAADQALRAGEIVRRLRDFVTRGETDMRVENLPSLIRAASDLASVGTGAKGMQARMRFDPRAELVLETEFNYSNSYSTYYATRTKQWRKARVQSWNWPQVDSITSRLRSLW